MFTTSLLRWLAGTAAALGAAVLLADAAHARMQPVTPVGDLRAACAAFKIPRVSKRRQSLRNDMAGAMFYLNNVRFRRASAPAP